MNQLLRRVVLRTPLRQHRDTRTATVVSGTWYFGYGPKNYTQKQ